MDRPALEAWHPDRSWADPFIATLALLIALVVSMTSRAHHAHPAPPPGQVELQGRLADLVLAAPKVLGRLGLGRSLDHLGPADPLGSFPEKSARGWDRAVLAVHAGEYGQLPLGGRLAQEVPGTAGGAFRLAWTWAYEGTGRPPLPGDLPVLRKALGNGYAASILEARCLARSGGDPGPLESRALDWASPRLAALGAGCFLALLLWLGGLGYLVRLLMVPRQTLASALSPTRFAMSGRAALIVLLGWFLTHLASGLVVGVVLAALPFLRPMALPLMYGFHATLGTAFLCQAEGIGLATLLARLCPGSQGRALATGLGCFALAFTAVVAVAVVMSPFLQNAEPPQRELMDLLGRTRGPLALAAMFLTIAVVAPIFEELLFRGFLLPWLGERLVPRLGPRWGWALAITVSGLTFGAMHLQPQGLPTLCTLGLVLGLGFLRTGNLLTSILVHGLWNGGIFLVMRFLV